MGHKIPIVSAIPDGVWDQAVGEKDFWVDLLLPEIARENRIYLPSGGNKALAVKRTVGPLSKSHILLDDYNKNLEEWEAEGGRGIKFINEINHKGLIGPLWEGDTIHYELSAEENYQRIFG